MAKELLPLQKGEHRMFCNILGLGGGHKKFSHFVAPPPPLFPMINDWSLNLYCEVKWGLENKINMRKMKTIFRGFCFAFPI